MLMHRQESLYCDVLIIGSGGAGLRSAIAARMKNADVILISKTRIGPCSNTYISKAVIASTGWGSKDDDENSHIADTVKGGRFLNDQFMVAKVAERAHSEITFLEDCGVNFDVKAGIPQVIKIPGHQYSRHVYGVNWKGSDLIIPLKRKAKQIGVRFVEQVFVTRLFAAENRICGASGITSDGGFISINAKVIVLATGGYGQIYLNTNNVPGITGDGQALAYNIGIPLKDMEFVQFYPTAMGKHGSRLILYEKMLAQPGVVLINGQGEKILQHHGIADPTKVTRDQLAQLITEEITKENPPSEQGVFMDMEKLSEKTAKQLTTLLPSKWWKGQKVFKVTPTAHFCMGGIATNRYGETSLKGLFAVGESTAGVHGANRLGGNALAEIFTMGSWVGDLAVKRSIDLGPASEPKNDFKKERSRLEGVYSENGSSVKQLINELKLLMWSKAGVIRQERDLVQALEHLRMPLPRVAVSNSATLIKLLEFQNMRSVATMVCQAALERTESRGSHFRSDYPEEDNNNWIKNIVLRKNNSDTYVGTTPVSLDLVELE